MAGIVYVFQDHYPWDVRAEKFACAMTQAGHSVSIVSRNRTGAPVRDEMDGYAIRRLPRGWGAVLRDLLNFPAFFSPVWIGSIVTAVRSEQAKLIVVRDLPLAPAAYWAGKMSGVPVVMDMAEDYPAMIAAAWEHDGKGPLDTLVRNPRLLASLERWIVPKMDGVIVVSAASGARVTQLAGDSELAVEVVSNTPRLELHTSGDESALVQQIRDLPGLKLLYVGQVTKARGISTVIQALTQVKRQVGDVSLIVVGDGIGVQALQEEAQAIGLADSVLLAGWVDQQFVPKVVAAADICLVPHFVDPHIDTTLPNKIYDYMLQARPVLVTHSQSLREVVEQNNCGFWYHDTNSAELADAIIKLADPELRAACGNNGRQAVLERLNWDVDAQVLNDFVQHFVSDN